MSSAMEADVKTSVNDYENEKIIARNRLKPRAYFLPKETLCLNGRWDFNYALTPLHAPDPILESRSKGESSIEIVDTTSSCKPTQQGEGSLTSPWTSITVPGHWELQGFGKPQYTNVIYPFPVCPPFVPSENPTGTYRRTFRVPTQWDTSSDLRLRFDGVDSAYHLWVNGVQVGYAQGSRNPAEFDVTNLVTRDADNELFVRVYKWSDGSYIEDQDQWWLSGIFRDVHLLGFPSIARIEDFFVNTELDSTYTDAALRLSLRLQCRTACVVDVALYDGQSLVQTGQVHVESNVENASVELSVKGPKKWTAETPYLYNLSISLSTTEDSAAVIQTIKQRVGFRTVEIKNGNITVNGKAILLRGFNRHDHHPIFGRAVPLPYIRKDLLLMKQYNVNALRCSHYPSDPRIYELCDELGLWVMDEADLECHGFYDAVARPLDIPESMDYEQRKKLAFGRSGEFTSNNEDWRDAYVDRMEQLIQRDKNHPSVIMWSLGNEAFYGKNQKAMYEYAKAVDPGRPVHYEGDAEALSADMFSYMYPSVDRLGRLATAEGDNFERPIVLCEYGHAMGNAPGGMEEYMEVFRQHRRLQGGFIWEWANHGLWVESNLTRATKGKGYYAYGGDFGEYPHDGDFVMDGACYSNHTAGPGLVEIGKAYSPVRALVSGTDLVVTNEYDFVDLGHLMATYKIEAIFEGSSRLVSTGTLDIPVTAPGGTVLVELPTVDHSNDAAEIWITVSFRSKDTTLWDDVGKEVAWIQHRLWENPNPYKSIIPSPRYDLEVQSTKSVHIVRSPAFSIAISRATGSLTNWEANGFSFLAPISDMEAGISLGFWRPPTNNDIPWDTREWKRYGLDKMTSQLRNIEFQKLPDGDVQLVTTTWISPPILAWGYLARTTYLISRDGRLSISVNLKPQGPAPETLPRVGLDVKLNRHFQIAAWFGRGPGESYVDKKQSQQIGLYNASVAELHTPYEVPQENGNRVETRWVRMTDGRGTGVRAVRAKVDEEDTSLFQWAASQYSAEQIEQAKHPRDLVPDGRMIRLRLDADHAGVGTGACGPRTLEKYRVQCKERRFAFTLEPCNQ